LFVISNISILKYSSNLIKLLVKKNNFPTLQLSIRKVATILNKIIINIILKNYTFIRRTDKNKTAKISKNLIRIKRVFY